MFFMHSYTAKYKSTDDYKIVKHIKFVFFPLVAVVHYSVNEFCKYFEILLSYVSERGQVYQTKCNAGS